MINGKIFSTVSAPALILASTVVPVSVFAQDNSEIRAVLEKDTSGATTCLLKMRIIMNALFRPVDRLRASISTFPKSYTKLVVVFFSFFFFGAEVSAQGFKVLSQAEQPVLKALDHNADGILSTDEIQSSSESLKRWIKRRWCFVIWRKKLNFQLG